jgi:ribosome assembly protein YihI (activator of Der GTPase)
MATNDENEQFYDATEEIISNYIERIDFLIKFVTLLDENDNEEPENKEFRKISI